MYIMAREAVGGEVIKLLRTEILIRNPIPQHAVRGHQDAVARRFSGGGVMICSPKTGLPA